MRLDLTNPRAAYAHKLLRERRRVEFSIGYDPIDEQLQSDGSNLLRRVNLKEISLVLAGAAADAGAPVGRTELLSVKSAADDALSLRSHLRTGHAVTASLIGAAYADMVLRHRLAHTEVPGWSEQHMRDGLPPSDGLPPVPMVPLTGYASVATLREKLAAAVSGTKTASADVQATIDEMTAEIRRKNAEAEALRELNIRNDIRAASMTTGPTVAEEQRIEAADFARAEALVAEREAERATELVQVQVAETAGREALAREQHIGTVQ